MELYVNLEDGAALPAYSREDDAALDLRASESCRIHAGRVRMVETGVRIAVPRGYAALVLPRSGMACRDMVTVINAPGLIDPNYRGTIKVGLINHGGAAYDIERGDRIAQLLIVPAPRVDVVEVAPGDPPGHGPHGGGGPGL